jgi:hypothetical protein
MADIALWAKISGELRQVAEISWIRACRLERDKKDPESDFPLFVLEAC